MHYTAPQSRYTLINLALEIGDTVNFTSPQIYKLVAKSKTRNGAEMLHWSVPCTTCGALFETTTGRISSGVNRRCMKHRKPGRRTMALAPVVQRPPFKPYEVEYRTGKLMLKSYRMEWRYGIEMKHTIDGVFNREACQAEIDSYPSDYAGEGMEGLL